MLVILGIVGVVWAVLIYNGEFMVVKLFNIGFPFNVVHWFTVNEEPHRL